jgi:hypothetical protein
MTRANTKKGVFSKRVNFREQWLYLEIRVFLNRNQGGFINHARSDEAPECESESSFFRESWISMENMYDI